MDGVGAKKNVFIVGATNRPDILDEALLRPGRLDQLIYIPLPDKKSRSSILKAILRKTPIDPDVDLDFVSDWTEGYSGADIKELCNQTCKAAINEAIDHEQKKKEILKNNQENAKDIEMMEDPVPKLTRQHFETGMLKSRKSVTEVDLNRYDDFKRKFDPLYVQNSNDGKPKINWPNKDGKQENKPQENLDDLDLYNN
jgi:transitional endoplasmic reticulum ATPase